MQIEKSRLIFPQMVGGEGEGKIVVRWVDTEPGFDLHSYLNLSVS